MKTNSKIVTALLVVCFIALIGLMGAVTNSANSFGAAASVTEYSKLRGQVTDATQYAEIRKQFGDGLFVRHFPPVIPPDATQINFYFVPKFLQGGTSLQLRLKLPADKIGDLYTQFNQLAVHRYIGGDSNIHANSSDGVPTTFFRTSDNHVSTFPITYEILVLGAEPYKDSGFKWNHGTSYGVAIDKSASEIVYWLEDW